MSASHNIFPREHVECYLLPDAGDDAKINAYGASWTLNPGQYPIRVYGGKRITWSGGAVIGTYDPDMSWGRKYALGNSAAFTAGPSWNNDKPTAPAPNFTLNDFHMHNVWDGYRAGRASEDFLIQNCLFSEIYDDAVGADTRVGGEISDCLFDGVYAFFSSSNRTAASARDKTVLVRDCLIRLKSFPGPPKTWHRDPSHGPILKGDSRSPRVEFEDCVIVCDRFGASSMANWKMPVGGRDNLVIWTGEGGCPVPRWTGGFEVSTDINLWHQERQAWLARHPLVSRLPGESPPVVDDPAPEQPDIASDVRDIASDLRDLAGKLAALV